MMQVWGGKCVPSPSDRHRSRPQDPGQRTRTRPAASASPSARPSRTPSRRAEDTRYSLGSVLNHVLLHQTIIGLEAKKQLKQDRREYPDVVIGCAGGGSNFAGLAFPFVRDKINGQEDRDHPRRADVLPDDDPRAVRLRLRRHRQDDAAAADVHARPRLRARSRSTRAACATTAWRRS